MRVPTRLVACLMLAVLVACQPSASASLSVRPESAESATPEASSVPGSESASAVASSSATPSTSTSPEVGGLVDLTGPELFLASGIATEFRRSCSRATDLPDEAVAGLQCHPESAGIEAIGFYLFDRREPMADWYFARLAEFGVEPSSGSTCVDGLPGEGTDTPGIEGYEFRIGCYVDTSGAANVRMALPAVAEDLSVYVGAAGRTESIEELLATLFPNRVPGMVGSTFGVGFVWSAARSD